MIKVLTNNKNRTLAEIRRVFHNFGGKLGISGSVKHLFKQLGVIKIAGDDLDELELLSIDLGAMDTQRENDKLIIYSQSQDLNKIKQGLETKGAKIEDANFSFEPQNSLYIKEKTKAKKILDFMNSIEDIEEVVDTWANFDIDNEILKEIK